LHQIYTRKKQNPKAFFFPQSLDQIIDPENEVRIIDLFVQSIHLNDFTLLVKSSMEGQPAYNPKGLLKLYVMAIQMYSFITYFRKRMQTKH